LVVNHVSRRKMASFIVRSSVLGLLYNQAYVNLLHSVTNYKGEKGYLLASAEQSCKERAGMPLRSIHEN
jgi:hypothetical protein